MMADVLVSGHRFEDLVAHVFGIAGREADTHSGSGVGHNAKKVSKVDSLLLFGIAVSIAVDVLSKKSHFAPGHAAR